MGNNQALTMDIANPIILGASDADVSAAIFFATALAAVIVAAITAQWAVRERRRARQLAQDLLKSRAMHTPVVVENPPKALAEPGQRGPDAQRAAIMLEREQIMFEQHRQLNALQIAKLGTELELLRSQLDRKAEEKDRLEAGKEYHELMVEKTRLEIDSLRLHIRELRKRMEDWRFEDE